VLASGAAAAAMPSFATSTWNIAAINNNPFEYYASSSAARDARAASEGEDGDASYSNFMRGVERALRDDTDERADMLDDVLRADMLDVLVDKLNRAGLCDVRAERCREYYVSYARGRSTRAYLRDVDVGAKRLCSMPDRVTNTVNVEMRGDDSSGIVNRRTVYRPTVINCYDGRFADEGAWWDAWVAYMFDTRVVVGGRERAMVEMLTPIKKAKYPAVSEEEEELGVGLQVFFLAAFDAALVRVATLAAGSFDVWQNIRAELYENLVKHKTSRTLDVVATSLLRDVHDGDATRVCFLQEVGSAFADALRAREDISAAYDVCCPCDMDPKRDQNSIVLMSKSFTNGNATPREVTSDVLRLMGERSASLSKGDFCAFVATDASDGKNYVFASFHGDTDGLQTKHITSAVDAFCADASNAVDVCVFGMDANTHSFHKDGKKQGVVDFIDYLRASTSFEACWTLANIDVESAHTTFSARTFLQAQLNKAVPLADAETHILTDRHPKDHILIRTSTPIAVRALERINSVDFTSFTTSYDAGSMFPNARFPSDHAAVVFAFDLN
jgi:hypothetical protein